MQFGGSAVGVLQGWDEQLEVEEGEGYLYPFPNIAVAAHLGRIIRPLGGRIFRGPDNPATRGPDNPPHFQRGGDSGP